jgi:hypothetical protein
VHLQRSIDTRILGSCAEGPQGQPCLRFWTRDLTGWDGYLSPDTPQLFAEQHALLSFQAKGSVHASLS